MRWTWARLDTLGAPAWHEALTLRARVFVVEQQCAFQDPDAMDAQSWHLLGRHDESAPLLAYLRVVDPGAKYVEPALSRVVTAPEARGQGLGRLLVADGLARCLASWPGRGVRIGAQAHLEGFYAAFGFVTVGEPYDEDSIPHIEMWRAP